MALGRFDRVPELPMCLYCFCVWSNGLNDNTSQTLMLPLAPNELLPFPSPHSVPTIRVRTFYFKHRTPRFKRRGIMCTYRTNQPHPGDITKRGELTTPNPFSLWYNTNPFTRHFRYQAPRPRYCNSAFHNNSFRLPGGSG